MAKIRDQVRAEAKPRLASRPGAFCHGALHWSGLGAVALLSAACGSAGTIGSSSAPPSSTTSPGSATAVVKAETVSAYGRILTDISGHPLYTLRGSCTGSCASAWPALTVPAGTIPTGAAGVTGTVGDVRRSDGTYQVTYNGSPVFTFVQDSPGQVTGQGLAGFSVVTVSAGGTSSGSTTSLPTSSNY